ncbi:hypothetical protein AOT83_10940 [Mycobacteroides sp. H001]|nr:hypothetical protein AOT86_04440 [Mycobacteroides sp. H072]KRQ38881.1 hypothetical protein AOT84_06880 [Mycobacteroides sp. H002]KRQ49205.1 hypothetical protein AOT85_16155 [Mycobacteroides sp. H054]KRQ70332.1 hypothetical protein AOT83_10940 [Mycobacteroides sp. H001]OHU33313.1 hypothetical protein BKG79_22155 [Mycobacteroides chelonae]
MQIAKAGAVFKLSGDRDDLVDQLCRLCPKCAEIVGDKRCVHFAIGTSIECHGFTLSVAEYNVQRKPPVTIPLKTNCNNDFDAIFRWFVDVMIKTVDVSARGL